MIYGYARVSSAGQQRYGNSLQDQSAQLRAAGAARIYSDTFTGTKKHRPELDKLLSVLQPGDTLIVTKLDRIARSTKDGIEIIDQLVSSGVGLHVLNMGKFDATPTGKLMRTILFAFAEFERDMIVQRTQDGKAVARTNPNYREGRRPAQYDQAQFRLLLPAVSSGEMTVSDAAARLGVSRAKWYRLAAAENA